MAKLITLNADGTKGTIDSSEFSVGSSFAFIELNLGNTAKFRHQINVVDANVNITSVIDINFNYIDEKKDNDIELDFFVLKTISKNGSFDVIITSENKINKKINLKYKIQ